jgi:hypothetical protein
MKTFRMYFEESTKKVKIGKTTQDSLYVHKNYADNVFSSDGDYKIALKILHKKHKDFEYTIVKYNRINKSYSFIYSPDFDTADEPIVGNSINIKLDINDIDNSKITQTKQMADPWIYHHKWQFVGNNYTGFDIEKSKERSDICKPIIDEIEKNEDKNIRKKMGRKSYWENVVLNKLKKKEKIGDKKNAK